MGVDKVRTRCGRTWGPRPISRPRRPSSGLAPMVWQISQKAVPYKGQSALILRLEDPPPLVLNLSHRQPPSIEFVPPPAPSAPSSPSNHTQATCLASTLPEHLRRGG
eukprot:349694-Chlamydomonas_euryale.AAC.4